MKSGKKYYLVKEIIYRYTERSRRGSFIYNIIERYKLTRAPSYYPQPRFAVKPSFVNKILPLLESKDLVSNNIAQVLLKKEYHKRKKTASVDKYKAKEGIKRK